MPNSVPYRHLFASVRGRLTLLVGAIALPALLLGSILIFAGYRKERAAVANTLVSTARAVARIVDGEIDKSQALLLSFRASSALRQGDFKELDSLARRTLAHDDRWFVVTDETGRQYVNTRLPPASPLPSIVLDPGFLGEVRAGRMYVSNLVFGPAAQSLVVHVGAPYFEEDALKYTLNLAMLPASLARALEVDRYVPSSVLAVLDRDGKIVARTRSPEKYVGASATADIVAATARAAEGVVDSVTLEGIPVVTAFSRARCGWSVIIGAPKAELYASAQRLLTLGLVCSALLIAIAGVMAAWIGRALVHGVESLTANAQAVRRGSMPEKQSTGLEETDFVARAMADTAEALLRRTRTLEALNKVNAGLVAERDLEKIVQSVTDAGRETSGAAFGAFFYNVRKSDEESYMLFTLSGLPRAAFERFGMPRNTPVFGPTFSGQAVVRSGDITQDPRYGTLAPHFGMPPGHPPVRSYLAVPVKGRGGDVMGGLFYGHPQPNVFTAEAEEIVVGLAAEAAIAIDNAKLYHALAQELEAKTKVEAELRQSQQELEKKVEARTASLREAVAQMEEFSYTVSHDLRSPLRAMNAFAQVLLEEQADRLDATGRDYVGRIIRASERMDRLTMDLLRYSRVSQSELTVLSTDTDQLVRDTIAHYPQLQPPAAEIRVESPLPRVLAHEPALAQCFANLLTNAVKFVKPGETPRVRVHAETHQGIVRIWVEDNGIGIAPDQQEKLFRIFERATGSKGYEGTGVGLAIVRKAVERMGGTCGLNSDGRNGSRFWLELPAA